MILGGAVPFRPAWLDAAEIVAAALLGLLALALAVRLRPATGAALTVVASASWVATALAAVAGLGLLVDPADPAAIALATFAITALVRFVRDEWQARLLRLSFEQHLAPDVVRRIAADPAQLRLQGELREITALFTDIEGFTSMTERAAPTELVALLDAYFDAATKIVTDHGGMIDKIVGDAVHAIFNAPFALNNHPERAVACALALLAASEEVRASALGRRLALGRTRIGLETGPAIVGDVGGARKLDYTAHGNAMNDAARLEALNKELGTSICIGPGTAARIDPALLRRIATVTLRGHSQPIDVFTPAQLAGEG
jgi:adenylate cyclase